MSKYNFNIYGLSGTGTVVDMQQADSPDNRIQVPLMGHVVFRRNDGEIQPIVTLPAPNNGTPYSLEQDGQCQFHEKLDDATPTEKFFFVRCATGWDLYVEESLAGLSAPTFVKCGTRGAFNPRAISFPLSRNELKGLCFMEAHYTSSTLNVTGGTVIADLAEDAEPLRVRYNKIRSQLRQKNLSADERKQLAQKSNLLRDELRQLCLSWALRTPNYYARKALSADEREQLARQSNLLHDKLDQMCRSWRQHTAND